MKSKLAILLSLLIVPFLLATTNVQAADGSGGNGPSNEGILVNSFGFPPYGTLRTFNFCAVDGFGGLWHLTAANGTITGSRDNIGDCVWNVGGSYTGGNFHMDLTLTSGSTTCCSSGFTDGTASRRNRSAAGSTFWTGSCSSGPWAYDWTQCP